MLKNVLILYLKFINFNVLTCMYLPISCLLIFKYFDFFYCAVGRYHFVVVQVLFVFFHNNIQIGIQMFEVGLIVN